MISIIVAMSSNRVIGNDNSLIWNIPEDLKNFKRLTTNNTILMGRKTYESIGRLLPNRRNIIITRDLEYYVDGAETVNSLEEALLLCNKNCFIIGGGEIYKQSMNIADKIYLTFIDEKFEGDTYFPELDDSWVEVLREDKFNEYKYSFIEYEKYKF